MKTHRGAAKRFKVTATGKIMHARTNKNHILTKKAPKRKRQLAKLTTIAKSDSKKIKQLLPYL